MGSRHRFGWLLVIALLFGHSLSPSEAQAQEEVANEGGVVVIHRDFGNDMPAFSPQANVLAICGSEQLRFLDPTNGKRLAQFPKSEGYPTDLAWLPSGKHVVTSGDNIEVWEIPSGKRVLTLERSEFPRPGGETYFSRVAVSPDGKQLALGFQSGDVVITQLADRSKQIRLAGGHTESITRLVWHGNTLYSGGGYGDGQVCIWNTQTGKQLIKIAADERMVRGLAVHPSGKSFVTLGNKHDVVRWDSATGKEQMRLEGVAGLDPAAFKPGGVAFLSAGEVIVASQGADLMTWNANGQQLGRFAGHNDLIRKIDVSTDGTKLVSAGGSMVRIWPVKDLLAGSSATASEPPQPMPTSPDTTSTAALLNDIDQWTVIDGDWKQQGQKLVSSGFAHLEWNHHFPNDFVFSMKIRIHGDASPKVRFGSFHFGHEGQERNLFLHGPRATGERFPFQPGQELAVEVQMLGDQATLKINGQEVARSNPKTLEERTLTLQAGTRQSTGATEFYDLKLVHK